MVNIFLSALIAAITVSSLYLRVISMSSGNHLKWAFEQNKVILSPI